MITRLDTTGGSDTISSMGGRNMDNRTREELQAVVAEYDQMGQALIAGLTKDRDDLVQAALNHLQALLVIAQATRRQCSASPVEAPHAALSSEGN